MSNVKKCQIGFHILKVWLISCCSVVFFSSSKCHIPWRNKMRKTWRGIAFISFLNPQKTAERHFRWNTAVVTRKRRRLIAKLNSAGFRFVCSNSAHTPTRAEEANMNVQSRARHCECVCVCICILFIQFTEAWLHREVPFFGSFRRSQDWQEQEQNKKPAPNKVIY